MVCGETRRAITRHLGAMLILWLNKRVSHGSGVSGFLTPGLHPHRCGFEELPFPQGTCSPAPIPYAERVPPHAKIHPSETGTPVTGRAK